MSHVFRDQASFFFFFNKPTSRQTQCVNICYHYGALAQFTELQIYMDKSPGMMHQSLTCLNENVLSGFPFFCLVWFCFVLFFLQTHLISDLLLLIFNNLCVSERESLLVSTNTMMIPKQMTSTLAGDHQLSLALRLGADRDSQPRAVQSLWVM